MSADNVKKFYEEVKKSPEMIAKINELNSGTKEEAEKAIVEYAASIGFEFTLEELQEALTKVILDDDELDAIAGGRIQPDPPAEPREDKIMKLIKSASGN